MQMPTERLGSGDTITNTYDPSGHGNLTQTVRDDGTTSKIINTFSYKNDNDPNNQNSDLVSSKDGNANDPTSKAYSSTSGQFNYDAKRNEISSQDAIATSQGKSFNQGNVTSETTSMGAADNLMDNSGFERGTSWPESWNPATIIGSATVTWGNTAYTGQKGIAVSNVSGSNSYVVVGNSVIPSVGNQDILR